MPELQLVSHFKYFTRDNGRIGGLISELCSVASINIDSRCNIPVNAVAHRKHKPRERNSSTKTSCKDGADCYSVKAERMTQDTIYGQLSIW